MPNTQDVRRQVEHDLSICLEDLADAMGLSNEHVLVVGASTSEVAGQRIGTATSVAIGRAIVETVLTFAGSIGCRVAFQCCEHLNRALVVEREHAQDCGLTAVSAIPVPGAGGAVAAWAYQAMRHPVLVESISADAGIDIGDTLIGMHIRKVAVPVRGRIKCVGSAHIVMARSRPPLIGGSRAVYDVEEAKKRLGLGAEGTGVEE